MAILTAGLLASGAFVIAGRRGLSADASVCGPGGRVLEGLPGPVACVHEDEPPAGVDVTERVRTRELTEREGASAMAYDAAEDLGVPSTPAPNASSPAVKCDGDGTSEWQELQAPMPGGRTVSLDVQASTTEGRLPQARLPAARHRRRRRYRRPMTNDLHAPGFGGPLDMTDLA